MELKETLIKRIVETEWLQFQQVQSIDGPTDCQQDRGTFEGMRTGQAISWSAPALESYLEDLENAKAQGRNLIAEKYAIMMAATAPQAYAELAYHLPRNPPYVAALIDEAVTMVLAWQEQLYAAYPNILKRGRPLHSSADGPGITSFETYLRSELATYSLRTLKLYISHIRQQKASNINGARITLTYMVSSYGYDSLEAANQALGESA